MQDKLPWELCRPLSKKEDVFKICNWVNKNMGQERAHRQKQLWIWGPTAKGKTTLCLNLEKYFQLLWVSTHDKGWIEHYDTRVECLIFDEFVGGIPASLLNNIVEGAPCLIPCRGTKGVVKRKNIPVIILSNLNIQGVYHNLDRS